MKIKVAGMDGSLRNFGIALMEIDLDTMEKTILDLILIKTEKSKVKSVRSSSDNFARSRILAKSAIIGIKGSACSFIEVPSGGQNYDAVLGFGIVIGIYAATSLFVPPIEVSPSETKMAAVGSRSAAKEEIIEWATTKFPDAPWRRIKRNGQMVPTADNEHLADAVAIIHAGLKTPEFQQVLSILRMQNPKSA